MVQVPRPITYVIDYSEDHLERMDSYISKMSEAPPHLLHVGHDTPINNTWGAMRKLGDRTVLMTPEEVRSRIETISVFTERLHSAGVEIVIPYICNQTIAGDPSTRRGIWMFYDHWEEYSEFGFEERPADPIEWLAREPYGRPHYNYEKRHRAFLPLGEQRYAPCPNNLHYRTYQKAIVENIAKVGYDGVFVDNNIVNCYCRYCQQGFKEYLLSRYSEEEIRRVFGFSDPSEIHLSTKGNALHWVKTHPTFRTFLRESLRPQDLERWLGTTDPVTAPIEEGGNGWLWNLSRRYLRWLSARYPPEKIQDIAATPDPSLWGIADEKDRALWAETKLFWAASVARNLHFIKDVGRRIASRFVVVPNWGEMQHSDGAHFREEIGHDAAVWSPHSDWMMFEESNAPGRVAPCVYLDFVLQLKYASSIGVKGAILHQGGRDPTTAELSYAECLSCLGTYIQPGTDFPSIRSAYRAFQENNGELLEGWSPGDEVGLAYFFSQLRLENHRHLDLVYKTSRYLLDQHIPFRILSEENFEDKRYRLPKLIILPAVSYMKTAHLQRIKSFLARGGTCIVMDDFARFDDRARPRPPLEVESIGEEFGQRFIRASCDDLIPSGGISLDQARRVARPSWKAVNVPSGTNFELMQRLDEELGIQKFVEPGKLTSLINEALGYDATISHPFDSPGIRFHAYHKGGKTALHMVNYNVDLTLPPDERKVEAVESLQLSLPLREGVEPMSVTILEPGSTPTAADFSCHDNRLKIRIEQLKFYKLVLVS